MKARLAFSTSLLLLGAVVVPQTARADTVDANCEVRKDGDKQKGKSGPCTFSHRQGYIDIDLKNGDTVALRPTDKANHFKDQHGNKVVRTQSDGSTQKFKWENGRHINVTLYAPTYNYNKHQQSGYNPQGGYSQDGVGSEHPWAAGGGGSYGGAPPQVIVGKNGEGEVIFKNDCVVYYDKHGRRTSSLPACSSKQINHAGDAMARYRREQGMN
jgi:hypothetical protein